MIDSVKPTVETASVMPSRPTKKTSATANTDSMSISSTIGTASRTTARPMEVSVKSAVEPRTASRSVDQIDCDSLSAVPVVRVTLLRLPLRHARPLPPR